MAVSRQNILWAGYILSVISSILIGFDLSFNVYAIPLKETFNFTQTQVEVLASMSTIGLSLSFLQRLSLETFGLKCTFVLIWALTPTASALYSMATHYREFFHNQLGLMCVIQLILSTGMSTSFVMVTSVCVENFPRKHSGKIVGIYCAFIAVGTFLLAGVTDLYFRGNLGGFFLLLCLSSVVIFGSCLIVLFILVHTPAEQNEISISPQDISHPSPENMPLRSSNDTDTKNNETSYAEAKASEVLKSFYFHGIFWSSSILFGASYTCLNNLTAMARSIGSQDQYVSVYIVSASMFVARILFGVLFDHYFSEICGFIILLIGNLGFVVGMGLGMVRLDSWTLVYIAVLVGLSQGILMIIPAAMIIFRYGRVHYGATINAFFTVSGICQIIFQLLSGYLYDMEIVNLGQSGIFCNGKYCFYASFAMFFVITILITVVQVLVYLIDKYKLP